MAIMRIPISYVNKEWVDKVKNSKALTQEQKDALLRSARRDVIIKNIVTFAIVVLFIVGIASIGFWPTAIILIVGGLIFWAVAEVMAESAEEELKRALEKQQKVRLVNEPVLCSGCGAKVKKDEKFCHYCGASQSKKNEEAGRCVKGECSNCKAKLSKLNTKYCPACGIKLQK